jgi:hypothetical protein
MTMSEFNNLNNPDREDEPSVSSLPADFSEEDVQFAQELNALFSPQDEELPPYFAQTLLAAEDPRYQPVDHNFAQKTSVRVFRSLRLRRRLFPARPSALSAIADTIHEAFSHKIVVAWTAAFMLLMVCSVAFTAPSFERGMVYLLQGARSGTLGVHHYPGHVKHSNYYANADFDADAQPPQISLSAAQQRLQFKMEWPQYMPGNFELNNIIIYDDPGNTWANGPILELVYSMNGDITPQGTGQIVIREFLPQEEVLQVVQDGAAHPIDVDQNGNARAIYVEGQWLPRGKLPTPLWSSVGRRELIYQQDGVVFWIAGDQRDGVDQSVLWSIAQSLHRVDFSHLMLLKEGRVTLLQAEDSSSGPFANDVLAIFPNGNTDGPSYINMSSKQAGIAFSKSKPASHGQ